MTSSQASDPISTESSLNNTALGHPIQVVRSRVGEYGSRNLFVGNLAYRCTADQLKALFVKVGKVISAEIVSNEHGSKGYGFVMMKYSKDSIAARELFEGKRFLGRKLIVNFAQFKNTRFNQPEPPVKYSQAPPPLTPFNPFSIPPPILFQPISFVGQIQMNQFPANYNPIQALIQAQMYLNNLVSQQQNGSGLSSSISTTPSTSDKPNLDN